METPLDELVKCLGYLSYEITLIGLNGQAVFQTSRFAWETWAYVEKWADRCTAILVRPLF